MRIKYTIDPSWSVSLSFIRWLQLASLFLSNFYMIVISTIYAVSMYADHSSSTTMKKVQGSLVLVESVVSTIISSMIYMHLCIELPSKITYVPLFLSISAFIVRVSTTGFIIKNIDTPGVNVYDYNASSGILIFTIISWVFLTEIDIEITFDKPISVFNSFKQFIRDIPKKVYFRSDSESQNSMLGKGSNISSYAASVARSDSVAITSSSLPSYRPEDLPMYANNAGLLPPFEGEELNIVQEVAIREKIEGKKKPDSFTVHLSQPASATSKSSFSRACVLQKDITIFVSNSTTV